MPTEHTTDISERTTAARIEAMRAFTAMADYTSQGLSAQTEHEGARAIWLKEHRIAWNAFYALPVRDQRTWAEPLFAACLGVPALGHVAERLARSSDRARQRMGSSDVVMPVHLIAALARTMPDLNELLGCFASATWTATHAPAPEGYFMFAKCQGFDRVLELQVFTNPGLTRVEKVYDVGAQAWVS